MHVPDGGFVSAFLCVVPQCDPSPFRVLSIIYSKCQYILGEKGLSECRLEGIGNAWNSCTAGPGIPGRLGVCWAAAAAEEKPRMSGHWAVFSPPKEGWK